jgi:isopenicillin-N epimerase
MKDKYRDLFPLKSGTTPLNHGSFGKCPLEVIRFRNELADEMESLSTIFYTRKSKDLVESSRTILADFLGTPAKDIVFVKNATTGVNTVINSILFEVGDEVVTTDLIYSSCRNLLEKMEKEKGIKVRTAKISLFPQSSDEIYQKIIAETTKRTKLIFIDHISSESALIMPVKKLSEFAAQKGIEILVDGAHAPGMIPLDITELGVTYYTGNCHKWICAPKGSAFLYVKPEKQDVIIPRIISNYISYICVGKSIEFIESSVAGGWKEVMQRNHELVLKGREIICEKLDIKEWAPDELTGSLTTLKLGSKAVIDEKTGLDKIQLELFDRFGIEALITTIYPTDDRILRLSAAIYNREEDYEKLGKALKTLDI